MTNSTFSFWAAFLADPQATRVFVGVSETQPCAFRNRTLFARGCPANFQVTNIDLIPPAVLAHRPPRVFDLRDVFRERVPEIRDGLPAMRLLTLTSSGYVDMTCNMLHSLLRVKSRVQVLVACQDDDAFHAINERRAELPNCIPLRSCPGSAGGPGSPGSAGGPGSSKEPEEQQIFGSPGFNSLVFNKLDVISQILQQQATEQLAFVDSDVIFLRDPASTPLMSPLPDGIDVMFQCDERVSSQGAGGAEEEVRAPTLIKSPVDSVSSMSSTHCNLAADGDCKNLCTGVMVLRNNARVRRYLDYRRLLGPTVMLRCPAGEQTYMNLARGMVSYGTLSTTGFPNGSFLPTRVTPDAVLIHFNYLVGNLKKKTMKALGFWYM